MDKGWIKLHRILKEKVIWKKSTPEQKVILITILLMANHKENEWEWLGEKFKVMPGQLITSLDSIQKECGKGISIQNVRTAISKFEKYEFLTNKSTKTGRLLTIVNWSDYQSYSTEANKEDNKELTESQQRPNKDLTPNKNDKNEKNIYNRIFDYWNSKEIIKHKKINQKMKNEINKALKDYTEDEIKLSIDHYSEMLNSDYKYCNYKWGLDTFLKRAEGYTKFMDDGDKWISYKDSSKKPKKTDNSPYNRFKVVE